MIEYLFNTQTNSALPIEYRTNGDQNIDEVREEKKNERRLKK